MHDSLIVFMYNIIPDSENNECIGEYHITDASLDEMIDKVETDIRDSNSAVPKIEFRFARKDTQDRRLTKKEISSAQEGLRIFDTAVTQVIDMNMGTVATGIVNSTFEGLRQPCSSWAEVNVMLAALRMCARYEIKYYDKLRADALYFTQELHHRIIPSMNLDFVNDIDLYYYDMGTGKISIVAAKP